jgi:hypothetical protein
MTLPADDAATPPDSRTAGQVDLDTALAAAAEARKAAAIARANAARQLADYMVGELPNVASTPAETSRQLAQYRHAIDVHKTAHDKYVAADLAWTRG